MNTLRLLAFLISAAVPISLWAHPHNWVELNSTFVIDKHGKLTHITQRWQFDVFYSTMSLADTLAEFGTEEKGLPKLAKRMVNNLAGSKYFSELMIEGTEIPLGRPISYSMSRLEQDGQLVLALEMTFQLALALPVENRSVGWRVFDPTYYVAMMHANENSVRIVTANATECGKHIYIPDPSDEMIEYAASLDRTQRNTTGLGDSFAERVELTCL